MERVEKAVNMPEEQFKRIIGTTKPVFQTMLEVLQNAFVKRHRLGGKPPTLTVGDQGMTAEGRWVYARYLRPGDALQSRFRENVKLSKIEISFVETVVYNFLVDDLHCYAVGEDEVLVHNNNGPGRSNHANMRAAQGRPVGSGISDAQKASQRNVLIQDDGRYIVLGANGRVHVFDANGVLDTSFRNSAANTRMRILEGRWSPSTEEQFNTLKSLLGGN